jgi:HAD superfamily hydrolase (TIGR01509 family)
MNELEFLEKISGYENVIFDYGGVLLNIDYDLTVDALSKLSPDGDASFLYTKKKQVNFFDMLETGKISELEFLERLAKELNINISLIEDVRSAWNSMLLELRDERVRFVQKLSQEKNIYMLSNINQIHEDFLEVYLSNIKQENFYDIFKKVYFSHKVGLRKPDAEIFEHVVADSKLDKSKTIFIDDSFQHIQGASGFGLATIFLEKPNTFIVGG